MALFSRTEKSIKVRNGKMDLQIYLSNKYSLYVIPQIHAWFLLSTVVHSSLYF